MSVTIKCNLNDGPKPKEVGGLLLLGVPFETKFVKGDKLTFKLGVSFDVPVMLLAYPFATEDGVVVESVGDVVLPNQEIVVSVTKKTNDVAFFERGRTLVCALPLVKTFNLDV